jgi:lipopolysaccharide/colanic/teichoic acid biosynthesis glycosyltransferase
MSDPTKYNDSRKVLLLDSALSVLASLLALLLLRWLTSAVPGFISIVLRWIGFSLVASLAGFFITGCYHYVRRFATIRSLGHVVLAVVAKEAILAVVLLLRLVPMTTAMMALSLLLADLLLSCVFLLSIRLSARLFSTEGDDEVNAVVGKKNVLVAGTGEPSLALADEADRGGIYNVVGLLSRNKEMEGRVIHDRIVYWCESFHEVDSLQWRLGGIDAILFPNEPDEGGTVSQSTISDHPQHDGMNPAGRAMKRGFDAVASALLLLVFSPLIALCAAAVKLEDGGPVLYAQERIGLRGLPFHIYKFRSMREDAEAEEGPQLYSGEEDPRLTRVGRFLRAHHLDELPQLWNVLRGDMSLIGYRPERAYYIDQIMARNPRYRYLYQIRPGVTSYATLYNGYTDTLEKMLTRLDLDLYYLRNRSVWFDLKVLGLTFLSIVIGRKF